MDKYDLLDFDIFKDFGILRERQIFIWGAAPKGRQIKRTLESVGIQIAAFCDSDVRKWGTLYDGITVLSPYKLKLLQEENLQLCIISCIANEMQLIKTFQEFELEKVFLLSYWGIKTACILYGIPLEPEGSLATYDALWMYQKRCALKSSGDLLNFLKKTELNTPGQVWNLQPGKVASKTIETRLKQTGIPSIHLHELTYPSHLWADELKTIFDARIQSGLAQGVKIITGVREPLARDYSAFWQPFTGERSYLMPILCNDFQKMYECYLSLLFKEYNYKKEQLKEACSDIWRDEFEWFNEEIKQHIGIDVYKYPFDREKGYQIIRRENVEIFIYKTEKVNDVMPMLSDFLEADILSCEDSNLTEDKAYNLAYKEFRKRVKLPCDYVDHYYNNNPYMDHFYTKEEQKSYLSQWEGCINE